ncbi:MAG: helix-turn-helix domain-containing protein [Ilumatobacteraceae bacterium]
MGTATRERLEAVALELFEREGYDHVTTARIAEAAGVTQRTFFRHFGTKLDALLGDVSARMHEFAVALHRQPPDLPLLEALERTIAATLPSDEQMAQDLVRGRILRDTESLAGVLRSYEEELESHFAEEIAQRTRRDRADFDVRGTAALLVAARRVVVTEWLAQGVRTDIVGLARRALSQLGGVDAGAVVAAD